MPAIELNKITKKYPGTTEAAVESMSIQINEGEITTLLGPSGCGKTTTLRLIAGFEKADCGCISLGGKVVSDDKSWIPPEKRGVGMAFQDYALFPHLNVFNNIGFGYREKDKRKRIYEVLELVNLNGLEKRFPHELSGGQQQRVALARALARKPVVVVLDEPFSNLDADLRMQMRYEVKRIIKEARATAVFVTHDQRDALAISDRIAVMKHGVIQQYGTPREIYRYPENRFVATFVGQTNIIPGIISDNQSTIDTGLGLIPCTHTHDLGPGENVYISIRPDSLEMDEQGDILGIIRQFTYTGQSYEVEIEAKCTQNKKMRLMVHMHPEQNITVGMVARFKVLPDFTAVINHE